MTTGELRVWMDQLPDDSEVLVFTDEGLHECELSEELPVDYCPLKKTLMFYIKEETIKS